MCGLCRSCRLCRLLSRLTASGSVIGRLTCLLVRVVTCRDFVHLHQSVLIAVCHCLARTLVLCINSLREHCCFNEVCRLFYIDKTIHGLHSRHESGLLCHLALIFILGFQNVTFQNLTAYRIAVHTVLNFQWLYRINNVTLGNCSVAVSATSADSQILCHDCKSILYSQKSLKNIHRLSGLCPLSRRLLFLWSRCGFLFRFFHCNYLVFVFAFRFKISVHSEYSFFIFLILCFVD